ncbi:MAG: hypothetical protein AB1Z98_40660 [Nannocystaceae bacterium]
MTRAPPPSKVEAMHHRGLAIGLVVTMASGCKADEVPAASPTPDVSEVEGTEPAADAGDGNGSEQTTRKGGGLASLTNEIIDEARATAPETTMLIPDSAEYVTRLRLAELLAYPPAKELWRKLEDGDDDFRSAIDVFLECVPSLELLDDVVIGFDPDDHLALAAHAPNLGKDETWRCFGDKAVARGKDWELTLTGTARGEGPQLRGNDGETGYFVDDDTVVMVSKEWDAEVVALLGGGGTSAVKGRLAAPAGRVGTDSPLWLAGRIGLTAATGLSSTPFAGMTDLHFALRVEGDDLVLDTALDAGEAADATRMRDELERQFEEYKSFLPMMGFPASVTTKIAFETEGDLVTLTLPLTKSEIDEIRGGIERTF